MKKINLITLCGLAILFFLFAEKLLADCPSDLGSAVLTQLYPDTDGHSQDEPPPIPPDYYDHPVNTNPILIFEDTVFWAGIKRDLYHPPVQISENINAPKTPALTRYGSTAIRDNSSDSDWFRYCLISLGGTTDNLLGNIWDNKSSSVLSIGRSENKKNPGFYLMPPNMPSKSKLTDIERDTLINLLTKSFQSHLFSSELMKFVYGYRKVLNDSTRDEFFGRALIEENEISVGGWFGKFISLGIFADFEDVGSFLDKAVTSFKLPPVDKDKVAVYGKGDEFLYSLKDRENMFILKGYKVRINCEFTTGDSRPNIEIVKVIELIKYYDEEFMP